MIRWPKPLSGSGPLAAWLNRLLFAARTNELLPGAGYRINRQLNSGYTLDLDRPRGGGGCGEKVQVELCDPSTGETRLFEICGKEITEEE